MSQRGDGAPKRVLIVDDHAVVAEALAYSLDSAGIAVDVVDDTRLAAVLAAADHMSPDVILLDYYLGDGETALDLLPELVKRQHSIIILTGSADPAELGTCLERGAAAVLRKTQPLSELVRAVGAAVAGENPMSSAARANLLAAGQARRDEDAERSAPFDALTPRERAVLAALVEGKTTVQIAAEQFVSLATVRTQIHSLTTKLGVNSRIAAVALAREANWRG